MHRILSLLLLGSLLLGSLLLAACGQRASDAPDAPSSSSLEPSGTPGYEQPLKTALASDTSQYEGERKALRQALNRFYKRTGYELAWSDGDQPDPPARELIKEIRTAADEGLAHADYDTARIDRAMREVYESGSEPSPQTVARLDALLSYTFMRHAQDLYNGRIKPEAVAPAWFTDQEQVDLAALMERALAEGSVQDVLQELTPRHDGYTRLKKAMKRYRAIAQNGGWPQVPAGEALEEGDTSARVPLLRERLAATGDLGRASVPGAAARDSTYDRRLMAAVARFQRRHGLRADSLLGERTLEALNVPAAERVKTIQLNLERWHWLPQEFGERYIVVNIPEFKLRAYDQGRQAQEMPVVVGKEYNDRATPIFTDEMEHLIFSPYWNVPPGIAKEEIVPKAMDDLGYLAANHFEITNYYGPEADVYEPTRANLRRVAAGDLRLRQKSGPENALGLVKFMFPNERAIYLHDTPADHLFDKTTRTFSHGCVRVERPADLAAYALENKSGWDRAKIRTAMTNGEWQKVNLPSTIPVYLLYWTAYADKDGGVQFREDFYGHDKALRKTIEQEEKQEGSTPLTATRRI